LRIKRQLLKIVSANIFSDFGKTEDPMNNAYYIKINKLQTRNRAGMIRSYRTSRTLAEMLIAILDMILAAFDRGLDMLARPMINRILRGSIAMSSAVGIIFLISAIDRQIISLFPALLICAILVIAEVLCLRKN
jgi:hypothetical protein